MSVWPSQEPLPTKANLPDAGPRLTGLFGLALVLALRRESCERYNLRHIVSFGINKHWLINSIIMTTTSHVH